MESPGATSTTARPIGARPLDRLSRTDAEALGEEAKDLAALREAGVPIARGWVIPLDVEVEDVAAFLTEKLALPLADDRAGDATCLKIRAWFRRSARAPRPRGRFPASEDLADPAAIEDALRALMDEARDSKQARGALRLRVVHCDVAASGAACSVDASDGDPSTVTVWTTAAKPYRFDRKTMRMLEEGAGELSSRVLSRVADLADRAQLALGRPVEIGWVLNAGRPKIARVKPVQRALRFTDETWRIVELLWHDEGPIAPLAVDGLDKALREDDDPVDEARVRRLFARAYRRVEAGRGRRGERRQSFAVAAGRVARIVADVTTPISAARAFTKTLDDRLRSFDADRLERFDEHELARALRERQRVVIEAYELLDDMRRATASVLGAIEAVLGTVPRDCIHGLATIRRTRARRRLDERLNRALEELGDLPASVDPVPAEHRRFFADLRRATADKRPLGLDVRPLAYGASDSALVEGMRAVLDGRAERAEREQRGAVRRLMATARSRPLGRGRAALARTLTVVIDRLAAAKGEVADGLADANLRLRDIAIEAGRRLVERDVLDRDDDALYLFVAEIQDALDGEPGAYTARVRLRREEDARWRRFTPPTRLAPRGR